MLRLDVRRRLKAFTLEVALEVPARSVMVLVGESGAGKTTLLRLIAGLLAPDHGTIEVDGERWHGPDGSLPAARRAIGYVPQDHALFPHLTAAGNVAFGLSAQGLPRYAVRARVAAGLERLGIGGLASRRPHTLSGGQQQRVALARALVLEPRVLLLDEPLSALDAPTRRVVRGELRALLATLPCVTLYVTHSPAEALAFGERITVLEAGRVTQRGTRDELMRHPRTRYVAEFLGVNLFRGTLAAAEAAGERAHLAVPEGAFVIAPGGEGELAAVVHPRDITLAREHPEGSARNVFAGVIDELVPEPPAGERVRVTVASTPPLIAEVTRDAVGALGLARGVAVFASFKASGVTLVR